tara:strand:+ start:313 stop:573 length:261 start_codon:yes stop_codon:yes gene_type:complete
MLPKISKGNAEWLIRVFQPIRGGRVDNSTFQLFLKAYNILRDTDRKVGCFSCEGRSIAAMANSIFDQYEGEIKAIATKRTRKKDAS